MSLRSIVYSSVLLPAVSDERVTAIASDAARFNIYAGVTGLLLFNGLTFLQYFEGPEDGVDAVYGRVLQSRSHTGLVELGRGQPQVRLFSQWSMRLVVTTYDLNGLAVRGHWHRMVLRPQAERDTWLGTERMEDIALQAAG